MAGRKTAVPSVPAPPALGVAISEYETAVAAREKVASPLREKREALDETISGMEEAFRTAYGEEMAEFDKAELELKTRLGALKAEAAVARADTDNAVFEHAGWTITAKLPTAALVAGREGNLTPLIDEIGTKFPADLDFVLPRSVAVAQLKRLVNYCIAAERPLTYADITAEGKDMVVVVTPPEPKPEATPEHAETADAVAAASGTTWEDLTQDGN